MKIIEKGSVTLRFLGRTFKCSHCFTIFEIEKDDKIIFDKYANCAICGNLVRLEQNELFKENPVRDSKEANFFI